MDATKKCLKTYVDQLVNHLPNQQNNDNTQINSNEHNKMGGNGCNKEKEKVVFEQEESGKELKGKELEKT